MDIKTISLRLFGEKVVVELKEGGTAFKSFGRKISGRLIGRIWGERIILNDSTNKKESIQTVMGITLLVEENEFEIESEDIINLFIES